MYEKGMLKVDMNAALSACSDIQNTKPWVELIFDARATGPFKHPQFSESCSHVLIFIPKCHPELHYAIECEWAVGKRWLRKHCRHTMESLRENVHCAFEPDVISLELSQKHFCKTRDYHNVHKLKQSSGANVDDDLKKYKTHRRIFESSLGLAHAIRRPLTMAGLLNPESEMLRSLDDPE